MNTKSIIQARRGSVLILSLWVVFFLATLAVAIGSHVASVFRAAEHFSARTQARAAATAGAAQAAAVVMAQTNRWDGIQDQAWNRDETLFKAIELPNGETFSVVFITADGDMNAVTNIGLIGEEAKINLNTSQTNLLSTLFEAAGGLSEGNAKAISEAIVKWRDERLTDDRDNGYSGETSERKRRMAQIEDLLQIKGVDIALYERLRPYITVYGSALVNLNAADARVLESVAISRASDDNRDAARSLVGKLLDFRESGMAFETDDDYATMRATLEQHTALTAQEGTLFAAMAAMVTVQSTAFSGTAFNGSQHQPAVTVDFVWDADKQNMVMWRER